MTDHEKFKRDPTGAGDQVFDAPLADTIKRIDEMVDRRLDDAELDRRLADVWARAGREDERVVEVLGPEAGLPSAEARRAARKAGRRRAEAELIPDFVTLQLRLWLAQCGGPSYRKMATLSRGTARRYSHSTIWHKLTRGGTVDWPFIETIVTAGHHFADLPGEPDLDSWRQKYAKLRLDPHWIGSAPTLVDSFQSRRIGADVSRQLIPGRTAVITGLGGVGKTQLAADVVYRSWRNLQVDLVVWVTAASRTAIVSAFAEAATKVGVAGARDEEITARRFLNSLIDNRERRWLVVLDDLQDPADLDGLWPPAGNGNTLVTTRLHRTAFAGVDLAFIKVGVFEPDESIGYLLEKLDYDALDGTALADALGYLPVALAQAAAYISDEGLSCTEYLQRFRRLRLGKLTTQKLPDQHTAVVASTWNLSIEAADRRPPAGVARPLLELAALLRPDGIPAAVFTTTAVQALLTRRRRRATTAEDARDGLNNLRRLSLIEIDEDQTEENQGTVRVHELVQRAVQENKLIRRAEKAVSAADALLEIWPEVERDPSLGELLRNNTDALVRNSGDALWHGRLHQVVFRAGNSLALRGLPAAALAYWERLLPSAEHYLGPEQPDVLTIRNNLAWARHYTGDHDRALVELRDLLVVRRRLLGADHPNTLATRHGIAQFQAAAGDLGGAVALLRELVSDYERVIGPDERDTLNTRLLLAVMRGEAESAEVAVHELRALLDDYRRTLGPVHAETLRLELDLAGWLASAGRADEARTRIERRLEDFYRVFGPDHIETLRLRYYIADLRGRTGHRREAAGRMRDLHDDVHRLADRGQTEVQEIREWIELWSAESRRSAAA